LSSQPSRPANDGFGTPLTPLPAVPKPQGGPPKRHVVQATLEVQREPAVGGKFKPSFREPVNELPPPQFEHVQIPLHALQRQQQEQQQKRQQRKPPHQQQLHLQAPQAFRQQPQQQHQPKIVQHQPQQQRPQRFTFYPATASSASVLTNGHSLYAAAPRLDPVALDAEDAEWDVLSNEIEPRQKKRNRRKKEGKRKSRRKSQRERKRRRERERKRKRRWREKQQKKKQQQHEDHYPFASLSWLKLPIRRK